MQFLFKPQPYLAPLISTMLLSININLIQLLKNLIIQNLSELQIT